MVHENCNYEQNQKCMDSKEAKKSVGAYLEITMVIKNENRSSAGKVFYDYREPFLNKIEGALTKDLLIRNEDVQVLHGFDCVENAKAYLETKLFKNDVATGLSPFWEEAPSIKIYSVA